ncbi:MAG TPA: winged helix-turn-helix domain-containing protein [Dehalococcoidia bacterium]|nr:winged helix-turn-helix domain-containing protein [Dehalococcoidia bacterium]
MKTGPRGVRAEAPHSPPNIMPAEARTSPDAGLLRTDPDHRTIARGGRALRLSRLEFALLQHLLESFPATMNRDELAIQLWGEASPASKGKLNLLVFRLRTKLRPLAGIDIRTMRGRGYMLAISDPQEASPPRSAAG